MVNVNSDWLDTKIHTKNMHSSYESKSFSLNSRITSMFRSKALTVIAHWVFYTIIHLKQISTDRNRRCIDSNRKWESKVWWK